jgi:predicted RNase H-like nuclease (RuvC/YqgF family)
MTTSVDDEDDLYNDLPDIKPAALKTKTNNGSSLSLENQVKALEAEMAVLKEENENLKRNIGTLFRTARAEIRRKDAEIEALNQKLESKLVVD